MYVYPLEYTSNLTIFILHCKHPLSYNHNIVEINGYRLCFMFAASKKGLIGKGLIGKGKGGDVNVDVQCQDVCNDVCVPVPNKVCSEVPFQTQVRRFLTPNFAGLQLSLTRAVVAAAVAIWPVRTARCLWHVLLEDTAQQHCCLSATKHPNLPVSYASHPEAVNLRL